VADPITDPLRHVQQRDPTRFHPGLQKLRKRLNRLRIESGTVIRANLDDYTVDVRSGVQPKDRATRSGTEYARCSVMIRGGQKGDDSVWGSLELPAENSIVLLLFGPGSTDPLVLHNLIFAETEGIQDAIKSGLLSKLADVEDRVTVHPSGVEVYFKKDKSIEIKQPAGAEVIITPAGEIQIKQKSGEKIKVGLTPTDKVVMEGLLSTAMGAINTWLDAHVHTGVTTGVASSGPPLTLPSPTLSGHGSATVEGQP
jgi:hypothetical protein